MLKDILNYRRATRHYGNQPIDMEKVAECVRLAQLTPTSSNMQMYEVYHVVDKTVLKQVAEACLGQGAATTAQQIVIFVTRQDYYRKNAKSLLEFEKENVRRHSPEERWEHRMKRWEIYYGKYVPFIYARFCGI